MRKILVFALAGFVLAGCNTLTLPGNSASYINLAAQEVCGQLSLTPQLVPASVLTAAKADCAKTSQGASMASSLTTAVQAALTAFEAAGWVL